MEFLGRSSGMQILLPPKERINLKIFNKYAEKDKGSAR